LLEECGDEERGVDQDPLETETFQTETTTLHPDSCLNRRTVEGHLRSRVL